MPALVIDTATECPLIALIEKGEVICYRELPFGYSSSKLLVPEIKALQPPIKHLRYIAIGTGPGSYTGIRIGAVVAKTLAYTLQIPLVPFFCTLDGFVPSGGNPNYASLIDARSGGVYMKQAEPVRLPLEEALAALQGISLIVTPNATRLQQVLDGPWEWQQSYPDARALAQLAENRFQLRPRRVRRRALSSLI